jgi:16S rRNA (uracil1498-N3)-methyltransferase
MHRFFLPPACIQAEKVTFPPEIARQLKQVLHQREGQVVLVLDNQGMEYEVKLVSIQAHSAQGQILTRQTTQGEPTVNLALFLCLSQREKFEWMLQKCTEIGVSAFTPVISSRSLVQQPEEAAKKYPRWQNIIREAAEQSGRGRLPLLNPPLTLDQAVQECRTGNHSAFLLWEGERTLGLRQALAGIFPSQTRLALLVGPEGGFSEAEAILAADAGLLAVSLGARILRMETAALVASALVLYDAGEMNPQTPGAI